MIIDTISCSCMINPFLWPWRWL